MTMTVRITRAVVASAVFATTAVGLIGAPAHATTPVEACTLKPSASQSSHTEARSCFSVGATLSQAPAVGGRATLTFFVTSMIARDGVRISTELPPNLHWVSRPAGTAQRTTLSREPHRQGRLQVAELSRSMRSGQTVRYTGIVEAVAAGPAEISVSASANPADARETAAEQVFLTVGRTDSASHFGIADNRNAGTAPYRGPKPQPLTAGVHHKQAGAAVAKPAPQAGSAKSPGGTACATGTWNYTDKNGVGRPAISWRVEAWDQDSSGGDDLLASSLTGFSGEYTLCFDNTDGTTVGQDVYIKFTADNGNWRVQNRSGWIYNYATGVIGNVPDGTTADFGWLQPGDPTHMRGAAAFAATQVTWNNTPGVCWDMIGACRTVVILWQPDSTDGTFYALGSNDVHLAAVDPDSAITVSHEVTHSIMDDVYEDAFPSAPNCTPHNIPKASSAGCAWTEGFAEWLPTVVFNDPNFRWPSGSALNLETPTWGTAGWANGTTVEGRVAGALIDLTDSTNDGTDRVGEGMGTIWATFQNHVSANFSQFWSHRTSDGFDVGNNALGSLYQNTIDFGFTG
jgi:hypothetical protein